tara:strand:+ start:634 stop:1065 length:432 start_codon:yes stop_codon:yes gene_type:complete
MNLEKEIRKIKYITEDESNIRTGAIDSKTRKREVVLARMIMSNFLQFEVGLKEETLAKHIKRDRTSFYFYKKKHEAYMSNDKIYPEYNDLYTRIKLRYFSDDDKLFDGVTKNRKLELLADVETRLQTLDRYKEHLQNEIEILS